MILVLNFPTLTRATCRLVASLLFLIAAPIHAFSDPLSVSSANQGSEPSNDSLDTELQSITTKLGAVPALRSHFTQTKTIPKLLRPLVSEGTFLYVKDEGIIWSTERPFASTFAISKHGITRVSDQGGATKIDSSDNPVAGGFSKAFLSLFGGDLTELLSNFDAKSSSLDGRWTVTLAAKGDLERFISRITISGTNSINRLELQEPSGDFTSISFTPLGPGTPSTAALSAKAPSAPSSLSSQVSISDDEHALLSGGRPR